jgi:SSS family solute:Na+ symporter
VANIFFVAHKMGAQIPEHVALIVTVAATTLIWVTVTFLAPAADRATLVKFYRLVRPAGPGWKDVRAEAGGEGSPDRLPMAMLGWVMGCTFIYSALFGTGSFLYGRNPQAAVWAVLFVASGLGLLKLVPKMWEKSA